MKYITITAIIVIIAAFCQGCQAGKAMFEDLFQGKEPYHGTERNE